MRRRASLLSIVWLLLVAVCLPLMNTIPAKAQTVQTQIPLGTMAATTPGMRFGMNVAVPYYTETAYTDIMMESGWQTSAPLSANGYPTSGNASVWFSLTGDAPGLHTFSFYGEGIFGFDNAAPINNNGNFAVNNGFPYYGVIPSSVSVLPPNYVGNPTSNAFTIPAYSPGNNTTSSIYLPANTGGNTTSSGMSIPPNSPPNPLPILMIIPANSPPNPLNVVVTTCQVQYNIPVQPTAGYGLAQNLPYSWLVIANINPTNLPNETPNNFHLIRDGYPAWTPGDSFYPVTATSFPIFTKDFLNSFAPFCCLRFMDWMNTPSNYTTYTWADRPQLNYFGNNPANFPAGTNAYYTQYATNPGGGRSTCYENMIALCNATGCDLWLNVPVAATDDWLAGMANLIANDPVYHLNPWLHVYIEYGNEVWNNGFWYEWDYVNQMAIVDISGGTASLGNFNGPFTGPGATGGEMALRIMHCADIMSPILNAAAPGMSRPVFAGQFAWTIYFTAGLAWIQQHYGPPGNYIYGIAVAPYFGTVDPTEISGTIQPQMAANVQLAEQYGVNVVAYEAGQSLGSSPESVFNTDEALQQSQAMVNQYNAFATMWQQNSGDLCNFYHNTGVDSQFGYWGHLPLGYLINNPPIKYQTVAAMNNRFGCNCGNAQPPPPPPASAPTHAPAPAPAHAPAPAPHPTPAPPSTNSRSPGLRYMGNGRWWSPIYGNYSNSPSYAMPEH